MAKAARLFKPILRKTLVEEWEGAQDAELIIYNPQSVGGFHIAEALQVPSIMADALPTWVPTGDFPSFAIPNLRLGNWYNQLTYRLLPLLTGSMYGGVVRQWRSETLKLPRRSMFGGELIRAGNQPVPVLYSFSRHVLPPPKDWSENVHVTGYWILDETNCWQPPPELLNFLDAGPPPVFVGFGSMGGRFQPGRHTSCSKRSQKPGSAVCLSLDGVDCRQKSCLITYSRLRMLHTTGSSRAWPQWCITGEQAQPRRVYKQESQV